MIGRLWKELPRTAQSGDFLFTTLFQNASEGKPGFERPLACSFGQVVRRPLAGERGGFADLRPRCAQLLGRGRIREADVLQQRYVDAMYDVDQRRSAQIAES